MKPYFIKSVQKLHPNELTKRFEFRNALQNAVKDDDFIDRLVFSVESHVNGKVNRHNVRIWSTKQPLAVVELEHDSPKLNVFDAISKTKVYGPAVFLYGKTVKG